MRPDLRGGERVSLFGGSLAKRLLLGGSTPAAAGLIDAIGVLCNRQPAAG